MVSESSANNSIGWRITIGVHVGYSADTKEPVEEQKLIRIYRRAAEAAEAVNGVYISAVLWPSRVIYKTEWGCPEEGEFTYTFVGNCNPAFSDPETYRKALLDLTENLKRELQQSTVLLELFPSEVYYLKD
ncbi:MAG: hypothetical protein IJ794_13965 [Lachnospiraceae bacterium]|nr:hypothetical protein [Lachnospiraceae bacterium]